MREIYGEPLAAETTGGKTALNYVGAGLLVPHVDPKSRSFNLPPIDVTVDGVYRTTAGDWIGLKLTLPPGRRRCTGGLSPEHGRPDVLTGKLGVTQTAASHPIPLGSVRADEEPSIVLSNARWFTCGTRVLLVARWKQEGQRMATLYLHLEPHADG